MLNISKDSWHYKLIVKVLNPWDVESNLCPYVRQVFNAMLGVLLTGVAIIIGVMAAVLMVSIPLIAWTSGITMEIAILFCILWGFVGGLVLIIYHDYTELRPVSWDKTIFTMPVRKPREPSIFSLWLAAKHDKICPELKFNKGE